MKTLGVDQTNPAERTTWRESTALDAKSCTLCNGPPIFDSSARSSTQIEWVMIKNYNNALVIFFKGGLGWGVFGFRFSMVLHLDQVHHLPSQLFLFPTVAIFKQPSPLNHCIALVGTVGWVSGSAKHWLKGFWVFRSAISNLDAKCSICFQR